MTVNSTTKSEKLFTYENIIIINITFTVDNLNKMLW